MSAAILPDAKVCRRCRELKPLDRFHKNVNCKDGHLATCKECRKVTGLPYADANREKIRARARDWRSANLERADARAKEWARRNPGRIKEIARKHRQSDRGLAYAERYARERDPARRRVVAARYYAKNKDRYRNYVRNRRAMNRGAVGSHTKDDVAEIARMQGMKCIYCRNKLPRVYHADHVIPLALGGSNDKGNIQILCPRCNRRKGKKDPIEFANKNGLLF